jgi:predicted component of viral defense system (DUF524 family)
MEEEHVIVRILTSRIRWCKEKLKARERSYSMDLKPEFSPTISSDVTILVWEEGRLFYG